MKLQPLKIEASPSFSLLHHRRLTRQNPRKKARGREDAAAKGSLRKWMEIHLGISIRLLVGMRLVAPRISSARNYRHILSTEMRHRTSVFLSISTVHTTRYCIQVMEKIREVEIKMSPYGLRSFSSTSWVAWMVGSVNLSMSLDSW